MLRLITGLPGHGKTLTAVSEILKNNERPIFVYGIPELNGVGHSELENPQKWFEVPDGSLVVIDEAQKVFSTRKQGAEVPEHVSVFETHRHRGLDVILLTQHPRLIDVHVRRLVEQHQHVIRPFGYKYSVVYEWQACEERPELKRGDFQKKRWKHPKEIFKHYKSATVHTVKRRYPKYLFILPIALLFVIFLGWKFYSDKTERVAELKNEEIVKNRIENKNIPVRQNFSSVQPQVEPLDPIDRIKIRAWEVVALLESRSKVMFVLQSKLGEKIWRLKSDDIVRLGLQYVVSGTIIKIMRGRDVIAIAMMN